MTDTVPFQICIDCADPHRLVRFWAGAMGMEIEDHHDQIGELLAAGHISEELVVERDGRRTWARAAACRGGGTRLLFQVVPEPKVVKNRVHLDLDVGADARDGVVERLLADGATRLGEGQEGPNRWIVLADPEGNELCVG